MKKIILLFIITIFSISNTYAYNPTNNDNLLISKFSILIEKLYNKSPEKIDSINSKLSILLLDTEIDTRRYYILHEVQDIIKKLEKEKAEKKTYLKNLLTNKYKSTFCPIKNWKWKKIWDWECNLIECNNNYHSEWNSCELNIKNCSIANWEWEQVWTWNSYWNCRIISCNKWYEQKNWSCSKLIVKTWIQLCQDTYWKYATSNNIKLSDWNYNCTCRTWYVWNSIEKTSCVEVKDNMVMFKAIANNDYEKVGELILRGYDLNVKNEEWSTALMYSIYYIIFNKSNIIPKMLIESWADLDIKSNLWNTAAMYSLFSIEYETEPYLEILELLIKKWANLELKNSDWKTVLNESLFTNPKNNKTLKILIEAWVNLDNQDKYWNTILHTIVENIWSAREYPSMYDHVNIGLFISRMKMLIQAWANVNIKNNKWKTILMIANENWDSELSSYIELYD